MSVTPERSCGDITALRFSNPIGTPYCLTVSRKTGFSP